MLKNLIIIALLLALIYLYYQKRNLNTSDPDYQELQTKFQEVVKVNKVFAKFCQEEIGGQDMEEIRTKLNGKKLVEILDERQSLTEALNKAESQNDDWELEVDTLTRAKRTLETDLLVQSNSFKSLIKEKDGMIKRLEGERQGLAEALNKAEQEKKQIQKDLSNLHNLSKIQSQKVSDLEAEIKNLKH